MTYGHSQGGYGALKFSRALNATTAISFGPQFSIDPAVVGDFDRRFISHYSRELNNGSPITTTDLCARNIVVSDPLHHDDRKNVNLIKYLGGVECIPAPFTGHSTIKSIVDGGKASVFIDELVNGSFCLRRVVRDCRRMSPTYLLERALYISSRGRYTQLAIEALAINNSHPLTLARKAGVVRNLATHKREDALVEIAPRFIPQLDIEDASQRGLVVSIAQVLVARGHELAAPTVERLKDVSMIGVDRRDSQSGYSTIGPATMKLHSRSPGNFRNIGRTAPIFDCT